MQALSNTWQQDTTIDNHKDPNDLIQTIHGKIAATSPIAVPVTAASDTGDSPAYTHDLVKAVSALIGAVNCTLLGERDHARRYLGTASHSLPPDMTCAEEPSTGEAQNTSDKCGGGLAPWQIRRVSTHIEEHLSENVLCEDLSAVAKLSLSHFSRAFRGSFGCPPHAYLTQRRLERAQGLMLATNESLGQIALECGFVDQPHLSRLFHRFVGQSPAAWRRARTSSRHQRPLGDREAIVPYR